MRGMMAAMGSMGGGMMGGMGMGGGMGGWVVWVAAWVVWHGRDGWWHGRRVPARSLPPTCPPPRSTPGQSRDLKTRLVRLNYGPNQDDGVDFPAKGAHSGSLRCRPDRGQPQGPDGVASPGPRRRLLRTISQMAASGAAAGMSWADIAQIFPALGQLPGTGPGQSNSWPTLTPRTTTPTQCRLLIEVTAPDRGAEGGGETRGGFRGQTCSVWWRVRFNRRVVQQWRSGCRLAGQQQQRRQQQQQQ